MRSYSWFLMLPAFLNCSGQSVVAGTEKTKAEQLESSLPSWCTSACSKLQQCERNNKCDCAEDLCECTSVDDDCAEDCTEELSRWAKGGEECAAVGERIKKCIDDMGCDALGPNGGDCNSTSEERDACPQHGDAPENPGGSDGPAINSGGGGSVPVPVQGDGGTSYAGSAFGAAPSTSGASSGGAPSGGSGSIGGPVTCTAKSTSGQAGSANSATICERGYTECSDGHEYDWSCVQTSAYKSVCSCTLDGTLSHAFEWNETCPAALQVNVACGWHLNE